MKYWRGYLVAALLLVFTWALTQFAAAHTELIDMVYPYITRMAVSFLAEWSSGVSFCLWQFIVIALIAVAIATVVLMILLRWNFIQWLGWVLAVCSLVYTLHTGIYSLNYYAGSLATDIRLIESGFSNTEMEQAAIHYRDKANELAEKINRDAAGKPVYPTFDEMAQQAGEGYTVLVKEKSYSVFAGSTVPVKALGWSDLYTSMGITGVTIALTGEAAVNPNIPAVSIPFTMCHEMAHRMSIASENDANFAAFLACDANSSVEFQYSAYFMAYRYCYNALAAVNRQGAARVSEGVSDLLKQDMKDYSEFFSKNRDEKATQLANTANDTYLKVSGSEDGIKSYGRVSDLLINWYIQEYVLPFQVEEKVPFDPFDESLIDPDDYDTVGR